MKPLKIRRLIVGPLMTNCYVLSSEGKCIIVDPGGDPERIVEEIDRENLDPLHIISTHGHFDHILSARALELKYGTDTMLHEDDRTMPHDPEFSSDRFIPGLKYDLPKNITFWKETVELNLSCHRLTLIHTPGHTPGSSIIVGDAFILTGDTLFKLSIGRTDLGGDQSQIVESVKKIISHGEATKIYPGHGESSDIRFEILNNSYVRNIMKKGSLY